MSKAPSARLAVLWRAHRARPKAHTPRKEDYLEVIRELIRAKGYARMVDLSQHLNVRSPTVTKMVQRLHDERLVVYEKYRGLVLTPKGEEVARSVRRAHEVVARFLTLIGVEEEAANAGSEKLEHYLSSKTIDILSNFVKYAEAHPEWLSQFMERSDDSAG